MWWTAAARSLTFGRQRLPFFRGLMCPHFRAFFLASLRNILDISTVSQSPHHEVAMEFAFVIFAQEQVGWNNKEVLLFVGGAVGALIPIVAAIVNILTRWYRDRADKA